LAIYIIRAEMAKSFHLLNTLHFAVSQRFDWCSCVKWSQSLPRMCQWPQRPGRS